jgi:hypothetical protein
MSSIIEKYKAGIIGWDIGGVNLKAVRVGDGGILVSRSASYEIQRAPTELSVRLDELARKVGSEPGDRHAITMTAELSQLFRSKREGVNRILDAVLQRFDQTVVRVFATDGRFLTVEEARHDPLLVAASNWAASARLVARIAPDAILIDIGSTTTDIIPIVQGKVVAAGATDPDRLCSGELVYTGVVRSPVESFATTVPLKGQEAFVSAEGFALAGDVWVTLGQLRDGDYTSPTPDGRPRTTEFARERLARVVCADPEMVDEAAIVAIAQSLAHSQRERVRAGLRRVTARWPAVKVAVVTGLGAFLAAEAAQLEGLEVSQLANQLGAEAARTAPAAAVALLLGAA